MANADHLKFLQLVIQEGSEARRWNSFKRENEPIDLSQADLSNADLRDFNFSKCNLAAANLFNADLTGADFTGANLSYANFQRANLANAYLTGAECAVTQFQGANMVDANLDGAQMRNARLMGAYLVGASMLDANLEGANLRGATLKFANLLGANLTGANVDETDLTKVELSEEQIRQVRHYERAVLPASKRPGRGGSHLKPEEDYEELFREEDCCKILGIPPDASIDQITAAYRQRAKEYHPDRVANLGEKIQIVARREFERINHAYRSLTHHRSKPAVEMSTAGAAPGATQIPDTIRNKAVHEMTIEDFLQIVDAEPDNDVALYNLGLKYFQKGFVESAIKAYQRALEVNPNNQYARHNLKLAELLLTLSRH
ncbi:MAG: hypothetical protein Kow0059_22750 [Candidatus Sumerlaeia bacterium]